MICRMKPTLSRSPKTASPSSKLLHSMVSCTLSTHFHSCSMRTAVASVENARCRPRLLHFGVISGWISGFSHGLIVRRILLCSSSNFSLYRINSTARTVECAQ